MVEPIKKRTAKKRRGRPPGSTKLRKLESDAVEKKSVSVSVVKLPSAKRSVKTELSRRIVGPEGSDGAVCFSRVDLMLLELTQERVRSAELVVKVADRELSCLQLEYESKRSRLQSRLRQNTEIAALKVVELHSLRGEIEHAYQIGFDKIVYDSETGTIKDRDLVGDPKG